MALMRTLCVPLLFVCALAMYAQTLRFDSLALHLPPLAEGDTTARTLVFRLRNVGDSDLVIERVNATCGCTKVVRHPRTVLAGGCDSIVVRFRTDRNAGTINEPLFVYTGEGGATPAATLYVLGEVRATADSQWRHLPARMGDLRLRTKQVTFGADDVVMRVPCVNTGT
ncbi:MAG: DUF1573 domain-containing protein, partial [Bacteroidaceae bacterium]|nr:DUF1573 domain-containing protein [Bacteroidaceae bacterium]